MEYHNPVLLKESVDGLNIKPDGVYVDVTFGGGGHSKEILSRLGENGRLFGFDQDIDAQANAIDDARFVLIGENFRYIKRFLRFHGVKKVDGILGDLGVSSHQFDMPERGFSTRFEADLDMRMNQQSEVTAQVILNQYEESEIRRILKEYGELSNAAILASTVVKARENEVIQSTDQLKKVWAKFLPAHKTHKILAQIFQALRIEVNQEMDVLKEFLLQTEELLDAGGRLSVISYHSLEDRLVKRYMRDGMFEGQPEKDFYGHVKVPFKKVGQLIVPDAAEIASNNRARSAKLRIAEKI
jgi:16S rRNA (cytosine1402-N4)-methyltransferase